ncbi:50S ribosomal protein L21 [Candidatus Dojkabacteria bacterium]|nr:50S ribosomal protein L21 [Candidatus Dojkabacteria bacterium]
MKDAFVVIELGGVQHIVSEGDEIDINHINGKVGDKIKIEDVYLCQDNKSLDIGSPLSKYTVTGEILEQYRGKKIQVRKYKAKARYRRSYGHRQEMTKLRIAKISPSKASTTAKKSTSKKVSKVKK